MKSEFPTAHEYSSERAHYPAMTVVDIRSEQAAITDSYKNRCCLMSTRNASGFRYLKDSIVGITTLSLMNSFSL